MISHWFSWIFRIFTNGHFFGKNDSTINRYSSSYEATAMYLCENGHETTEKGQW